MRIWIQYDIDSAAVVVAVTVAAVGSEIADWEDEASAELSWSFGWPGVARRMKHHHGRHDDDDGDGAADHRTILNSDLVRDFHYPGSSFHHDSSDSRHESIWV